MDINILQISKEDLRDNCFIVKVGDKDRPATDADLDDVEVSFKKLLDSMDLDFEPAILVTHHAVEIDKKKWK